MAFRLFVQSLPTAELHKEFLARETGDSVKIIVFRPLSRALVSLLVRYLGLAPQALCCRLLRRLRMIAAIAG
jgi:hypothetical protein